MTQVIPKLKSRAEDDQLGSKKKDFMTSFSVQDPGPG